MPRRRCMNGLFCEGAGDGNLSEPHFGALIISHFRERMFTRGTSFHAAISAEACVSSCFAHAELWQVNTLIQIKEHFLTHPSQPTLQAFQGGLNSWIFWKQSLLLYRHYCTLLTYERPLHDYYGLHWVSRAAPSSLILYRCLCNNNIVIGVTAWYERPAGTTLKTKCLTDSIFSQSCRLLAYKSLLLH